MKPIVIRYVHVREISTHSAHCELEDMREEGVQITLDSLSSSQLRRLLNADIQHTQLEVVIRKQQRRKR